MKERLLIFVAMALLVFQVLISLPITIWLNNQFNFNVALIDGAGIFVFLFLASSSVLLLFAFVIPEKIRRFLLPIFILGSVLVYVQQNILVWDYGILDGSLIDFSMNAGLGLIDLSLWVGGILAFIFLRKFLVLHANTILFFMVILTLLATIVPVLSHDYSTDKVSGSLSEADKFSYSASKNIFLFVLDAFQSDVFWDIIDHDVQLKQAFEGFTFYPNTASVFAKTYPTIPLMLTGRKYQKQQPFKEFISTAYDDSMLTELVDQGWDVGLYPYVRATIALDESIMSNYADRAQLPERINSYLQALDLSLFRMAPHFLKSRIYNDGEFRLGQYMDGNFGIFEGLLGTRNSVELPRPHPHRELNFLENLNALATKTGTSPAFRFYHFYMPHRPFLLNRDLEYERMRDAFTSYREYSIAALKVMIQFMDQLKRLGIYDNSAIMISADHGGGEYGRKKYVSSEGKYFPVLEHGKEKASGKPLLLVKDYHNSGPLSISSKPVSLLDVAPTIAKFAGLKSKDFEGSPVDELLEGEKRERIYFHYRFSGWDSKYLTDFDVFKIDGDIYDDAAWAKTGSLKVDFKLAEETDYVLDSIVRYGSDVKQDADYMNAFLAGAEYEYIPSYILSSNGRIDLSLSLSSSLKAGEIYLLEVELAGNDKAIDVILELDNNIRSSFKLKDKKSRQIVFFMPEQLNADDRLDIRIFNSDRGDNGDALLMSKLSLKKLKPPKLSNTSVIDFSKSLDRYYMQGVWPQEWWGSWTSETETSFSFRAGNDFCQNTDILLDIKKFFSSVDPVSFHISLNGIKLETVKIESDPGQGMKYQFDCSSFEGKSNRIYKMAIHTDKVASPLSLGKSSDPRTLGVALVSLKFIEREGDGKLNRKVNER